MAQRPCRSEILWARARTEWKEKCQALVATGRFLKKRVTCHRRDIHLDNSPATSTALSSGAKIVQNSQEGKGRQCRISIDSLLGEAIDLGESESDAGSEAWSVHGESD